MKKLHKIYIQLVLVLTLVVPFERIYIKDDNHLGKKTKVERTSSKGIKVCLVKSLGTSDGKDRLWVVLGIFPQDTFQSCSCHVHVHVKE